MLTTAMQNFIVKNSSVKIISGERLTPENKQIQTSADLQRSDRVQYTFIGGEKLILKNEDTKSAPHFKPEWDLGT